MLDLTVYAGARSTTPAARDTLAWNAFADEVAALCREESAATDKRDLVAFGPYRLREGATRSAAAVERMAAVAALDLDGVDLERLRAKLVELNARAIVHGSPSDDESSATRKLRAYVALDAEHAPAEAGAIRASVAAALGVVVDAACSNADRIFFCGRLAGTPPRYCERFDGAPLVRAWLPPAPVPAAAPTALAPAAPRNDAPAYDAATLAIMGAIGPWHTHEGHKHALCGALGGVLRHTPGWTKAHCESLVRAWLPPNEPGVDVDAGVRWACAAFDKLPEEVSGRGALDAVIGAEAGAVVQEAALLPWRARRDAPEAPAPVEPAPGAYATLEAVDLSVPPPPLDYVVETLGLAPGKVSAVQGFACTAKTPFALLLATCVAAGVDFLGCATRQTAVAYVDHEPSVLTQERAVRIRYGLGLDVVPPLHYFRAAQFSEAMLDDIEHAIIEHGVGMVVHDTYSSAVPADGNFNDSSFRAWADALGRMSSRLGVLFVVLLHETKAGQGGLRAISGHGSLAGALQASIVLDRPDEADATLVRVTCARATRERFAPFDVRWADAPCEAAPDGVALVATRIGAAPAQPRPRSAVANDARMAAATLSAGRAIMRSMPVVMTSRKELSALSGESHAAANRALARLVGAGLLEVVAGGYCRTPAGQAAGALAIATALGQTAEFTREVAP